MIEIALYQPDIAANAGAIARLCACFGLPLTIIEPAGFVWSDSSFRRAGMDYLAEADIRRAASWEVFLAERRGRRLLLLSTKAQAAYTGFAFQPGDILLLGRESAGVPPEVHAACRGLTIPMRPGMRSLNVGMACAMVTGEALRQLGQLPSMQGTA
ncbi:MAG: tRNA (cytidine(34)-2'-O)-methyltransferase [Proteobacteria bacterium]|nr:tRNA (cytidine(34)-2'-O)-methyltransferase [Pseudomonadota bacterium]